MLLFLAIRLLCGKIYKALFANIMEIFFLTNIGILVLVLLNDESACKALSASFSLSLLGFVGLLGHHIYQAKGKLLIKYPANCLKSLSVSSKATAAEENADESEDCSGQHTVSYIELRGLEDGLLSQ